MLAVGADSSFSNIDWTFCLSGPEGPIVKGSAALPPESDPSLESPKKRSSRLVPSLRIPSFKKTKGTEEEAACGGFYIVIFCLYCFILFVPHFLSGFMCLLDLLLRPSKAEVFQLDGGRVLLVWRPVQSSDPVTYCVQCCAEGESRGGTHKWLFERKVNEILYKSNHLHLYRGYTEHSNCFIL